MQVRCLCGFLFQYPLVLFGLFLGMDASRRPSSLSTVCGSLSVRGPRSCSFVAPLRLAFAGRYQVVYIPAFAPYIPTRLAIIHPAVSPGSLRRSGIDSSSFSSLGLRTGARSSPPIYAYPAYGGGSVFLFRLEGLHCLEGCVCLTWQGLRRHLFGISVHVLSSSWIYFAFYR